MVKCQDCKQEMQTATSCTKPYIRVNGKVYLRNTRYHDVNKRCHDCGIVNGNIHHFGCDMERCPRCKGQIISCSCKKGVVLSSLGKRLSAISKVKKKIPHKHKTIISKIRRIKRIPKAPRMPQAPTLGSTEWVNNEVNGFLKGGANI